MYMSNKFFCQKWIASMRHKFCKLLDILEYHDKIVDQFFFQKHEDPVL